MNHYGVLGRGRLQLPGPPADQGVDDLVEDGQLLGVGEDDGAQLGAVQGAVRGEHVLPEGLDDRRQPGSSGRDDLARDAVGVDQHAPVAHEQP